MKTLEQILKATEKASKNGMFGLDACKESIKSQIEMDKKYFNKETSLYALLEEFVKRANKDVFFNSNMVRACWELINEVGVQ